MLPIIQRALRLVRASGILAFAAFLGACSGGGGTPLPLAQPQAAGLPPAAGQAIARSSSSSELRRSAAGPSGFAGMRVLLQHSLVADDGVLLANYSQNFGIRTIFVPIAGDDIVELLADNFTTAKDLDAMSNVANVYIVAGDNSWLGSPSRVPDQVPALVKVAAKFPKLAGILYTIDPSQLASWNGSERQSLIQSYLTLVRTLTSAGGSAFRSTTFTADPAYASVIVAGGNASLLQTLQAQNGVNGLTLLVPGGSASQQLTNMGQSASQITVPFWIEANASRNGGQNYHGVSPAFLNSNLTQLGNTVSGQNSSFAGVEVSGWSDIYDSLQSVLPQPPVFNGTLAGGPLVPAAGTTYLGGFVDPDGGGPTPAKTAAFESQIGRTLAYNMHFYGWNGPFPGANEQDDAANGRVPVIAWNCGDTDAGIVAGNDDALIKAHADALKAFGYPVFLRWFWEMNLNDTNNAPRSQCYDARTDLPNGYFSPVEYIAAWHHIRAIFDQEGASNVVWLWCVANAHGGAAQYYPGDAVVDWVGMDDYDQRDISFTDTLYDLSNVLAQFQQKPLMITETGAHAQTQVSYLQNAAETLRSQFPQVRGIGYLDSSGTHQNYVLSGAGLSAFTAFANTPYMSAMYAPAAMQLRSR